MNDRRALRGIRDDGHRDQLLDLIRGGDWQLERTGRGSHMRIRHIPSGRCLPVAQSGSWRVRRNFARQVRAVERDHAGGTYSNE